MVENPNPVGRWIIIDPLGFEHTIERDNTSHFGTENLAHCIDPIANRPWMVSNLLRHINSAPEQGDWEGYSWMKL